MEDPDGLDLIAESGFDDGRQEGGAVLGALAAADEDLATIEADVLDAKSAAFKKAEPDP